MVMPRSASTPVSAAMIAARGLGWPASRFLYFKKIREVRVHLDRDQAFDVIQ